jgi:hypothetical protein
MIAPGFKVCRCMGGPLDVFAAVLPVAVERFVFCWQCPGRLPVWLLYVQTDPVGLDQPGRALFEFDGYRCSREQADAWRACA